MRNAALFALIPLTILTVALLSISITLLLNLPKNTVVSWTPVLNTNRQITLACNYLVSNYNASLRLISETTAHQKYWLYSDNYLASIVVNDRCKRTDISGLVSQRLSELPKYPNQYQVFSMPVAYFNASKDYNLSDSIWTTVNNQTGTLSPGDYADIAFLESYYYARWTSNVTGAQRLYDIGATMYNSTGFVDRPFNGIFQTYKLALYVIVANKLNNTLPYSVVVNLGRMQELTTGGFYTGYLADYSTAGTTTNMETTSLAIMALAILGSMSFNIHTTTNIQPSPYVIPFLYLGIGTGITAIIVASVAFERRGKRV
jgi:hypothetical protein